jgi:hypothetical protein
MVLVNLRKTFKVFSSTFYKNWQVDKEDGKDYTFDAFCDLLINDQHGLLDEEKFGGKLQAHMLKGKGKINYKERGHFDDLVHRLECLD